MEYVTQKEANDVCSSVIRHANDIIDKFKNSLSEDGPPFGATPIWHLECCDGVFEAAAKLETWSWIHIKLNAHGESVEKVCNLLREDILIKAGSSSQSTSATANLVKHWRIWARVDAYRTMTNT